MHVALAALISACRELEEGGGLRATLPLAGRSLLEHQVRLALRAGAAHVIVLVERIPAALTAAVDRLRREGVAIDIARSIADAADRVHPDEALLVIADGCVAPAALVSEMAQARVPAVLTMPSEADPVLYERIDAGARWGGLLLIDGARLSRTAGMLGEWDLQSTLLRAAVQEGATRVPVFADGRGHSPPVIALDGDAVAALDRAIALGGPVPREDWPSRYIFPPIDAVAVLPLLRRGIDARWLAAAAALLALLAVPLVYGGWRWPALLLLLASGPLLSVARALSEARLSTLRGARLFGWVRATAAVAALLALAHRLAPELGWGCWLVAALVPVLMAALSAERRMLAALGGAAPGWIASVDALVWVFLLFAAIDQWLIGIGTLAVYAGASFALVQRSAARAISKARI